MTLTLDISDDLKPEEATELLVIAKETERPIGRVLLEAARELVRQRRGAGAVTTVSRRLPENFNQLNKLRP